MCTCCEKVFRPHLTKGTINFDRHDTVPDARSTLLGWKIVLTDWAVGRYFTVWAIEGPVVMLENMEAAFLIHTATFRWKSCSGSWVWLLFRGNQLMTCWDCIAYCDVLACGVNLHSLKFAECVLSRDWDCAAGHITRIWRSGGIHPGNFCGSTLIIMYCVLVRLILFPMSSVLAIIPELPAWRYLNYGHVISPIFFDQVVCNLICCESLRVFGVCQEAIPFAFSLLVAWVRNMHGFLRSAFG